MKKSLFLLLGALWCLAATDLSAQNEVRGVETRRAIYDDGPEYGYDPSYYSGKPKKYSTEYYGFEFSNRNSIPVSVSIELWSREYEVPTLIATKEVVLDPGEKYILKHENSDAFKLYSPNSDFKQTVINRYYVKYKAYKLE